MDATFTNLDTDNPTFIPGPQLHLAPSGDPDGNDVKVWSDITVADLDGNVRIKELVLAGTISISLAPDSFDAATATQGTVNFAGLPSYTVTNLPTGYDGRMAYASNGRAGAEGAGLGTGTPVVFTNGLWRRTEDLAQVQA